MAAALRTRGDKVTLRRMLDHTSGITDIIDAGASRHAADEEPRAPSDPNTHQKPPIEVYGSSSISVTSAQGLLECPPRGGEQNPDDSGRRLASAPSPSSPRDAASERSSDRVAIPDTIARGIHRLDPLPVTTLRLVSALAEEDVSLYEIARLIEFDQAMVANVLRLARSALYSGHVPPDSVLAALIRIGVSGLLDLVLGDYLRQLRVPAPMYGLTAEDDLWLHAAGSQLAVRALRQERPTAQIPAIAGTAALLHDIGKLIMVRYLKANLTTILDRCKDEGLTFIEAERQLFGVDHAEVGAAMADKWGFPEPITEAIERHHEFPLGRATPLLDAVMLANLVAKVIRAGFAAGDFNLRADPECNQRLGLDFSGFSRVCIQTAIWLKELKHLHGIGG